MLFPSSLFFGTLVKRYKRFLVDVSLQDGNLITAHCPNPGRMHTCCAPGWKVALTYDDNPKRKLPYTLELVHNGVCWIGVNTQRANGIVHEAIEQSSIEELRGYQEIQTEVPYGENSRIDFLLLSDTFVPCYVEVKSVSLIGDQQNFLFPDAVTSRGLKHLKNLISEKEKGHRAVLLFLIQRSDGSFFSPAAHIDPKYAVALRQAHELGVEILPYMADISEKGISVKRKVPFSVESK